MSGVGLLISALNKSQKKWYGHCTERPRMVLINQTLVNIKGQKPQCVTLAGVAQWIEPGPVNQRVAGLIPSQGTCLGCRPGP